MSQLQNDIYISIARGLVPGATQINKFGRNSDIDTTTFPEDIWDVGGTWIPPTTARIHNIVSSSLNDTSAGTGARTIKVIGLDENWLDQEETIILNGTTIVPTVNTYTRIFRMYVLTAGSGAMNDGNITATAITDATITAQITAGEGQTLMAIYTVPSGKTAYITNGYASINRKGSTAGAMSEIMFKYKVNADTSDYSWRTAWSGAVSVTGSSFIEKNYLPYPAFPGKTDLVATASYVSDNNSVISAGFDLILVDE